jgi:AraC family transcriptional regulator, positive regulator of tynA and feaB
LIEAATMDSSSEFFTTPSMDYEEWQSAVQSICGRYTPSVVEPRAFSGRVQARNIYGLRAVDLSCSAHQFERTNRDVRVDAKDHYYAVFQVSGHSRILQSDQTVDLGAGDVALVDAAQPITYLSEKEGNHWASVQLPRGILSSYLGLEPRCPFRSSEIAAARQLRRLLQDSVEDEQSMSRSTKDYMHLALLDLLGASFAPSEPVYSSIHTDKLFGRICDIIKDRFADPDFGPGDVAVEAGLSLRYVQKLFTTRNSTCSRYLNSVRLERAAFLLKRRSFLKTGQPIREIAYASGFGDYAYFNRSFRRRFGQYPSFLLRNPGSSTHTATTPNEVPI